MLEGVNIHVNKEYCNEFINQMENLAKTDTKEYYNTSYFDKLSKDKILEHFVFLAKDLMKHGEYRIAIENILSNFYDNSIFLDDHIIDLARKAFGEKIDEKDELLLVALKKNQ